MYVTAFVFLECDVFKRSRFLHRHTRLCWSTNAKNVVWNSEGVLAERLRMFQKYRVLSRAKHLVWGGECHVRYALDRRFDG